MPQKLETEVGVHLGRVEPTSPIELTTSRTEAPDARKVLYELARDNLAEDSLYGGGLQV